MQNSKFDITTFKLNDYDCVGMVFAQVPALEHFRHHVVKPSIRALDDKLNDLNMSDDASSVFLVSHIEDLRKRTIEGYVLTLQSMWERGLRGMLVNCESRLNKGVALKPITSASWSGKPENLQDHFLRLLGISIKNFNSFEDLNFLQLLANAIRHGDGGSAKRVYELSPSLWPSYVKTYNTPSFDLIEIPEVVLEQMMYSVLWFWEDIENIRCNSFKSKADIVVRKLSTWRGDIDRRNLDRVWQLG